MYLETTFPVGVQICPSSYFFLGGGGIGVAITFFNFIVLLVGSIGASMPNFSFLEGAILTIPGGVGSEN